MIRFAFVLVGLCAAAGAAGAAAPAAPWAPEPAAAGIPARTGVLAPSAFALATGEATAALLAATPPEAAAPAAADPGASVAGGALRSLAVPGWGQVYQGHRDLGLVFGVIEAALVTTLFVSIGQGHLRRGSSEETAELFAGIDLTAHDDSYRKYVSDYRSSDEYNRLVVYRDAAALYYGDPENYDRYIQENSLGGSDAWAWEDDGSWETYKEQRRSSDRAFQSARFAAAGMVVNRAASAITAAAMARKRKAGTKAAARDGVSLGGFEWTVAPTANLGFEHRLAWVRRF